MKLTRSTMFKHATLRYSSGDPVICRVSTVRKSFIYWSTWDLKPNSDFDLSDDVYKTDESVVGEIITWVEARKYLENAQR